LNPSATEKKERKKRKENGKECKYPTKAMIHCGIKFPCPTTSFASHSREGNEVCWG
jgi:hypothetical protein